MQVDAPFSATASLARRPAKLAWYAPRHQSEPVRVFQRSSNAPQSSCPCHNGGSSQVHAFRLPCHASRRGCPRNHFVQRRPVGRLHAAIPLRVGRTVRLTTMIGSNPLAVEVTQLFVDSHIGASRIPITAPKGWLCSRPRLLGSLKRRVVSSSTRFSLSSPPGSFGWYPLRAGRIRRPARTPDPSAASAP